MSISSFTNKKELKFIITLGTGLFGSSNNNIVTLQGYRAIADIDKAGGMMMGTLRARIYGVEQADMNSCTTLQWKPGYSIKNTVQVFAIDGTQETLVFAGDIVNAWGDYKSMPDVFFQFQAHAAYFGGLQAVTPLSVPGGVQASVLMAKIADQLGLAFENNNVNVVLSNVYLANTPKQQALALARQGNFSLYIDDKTLAITNKYAPRAGLIPLISSNTGLMGYPTFDGVGVNFENYFNPGVTFGGSINLVTDVVQAAGQWIVTSVAHRLESEKPNGVWMSTIRGNKNGLAVTA